MKRPYLSYSIDQLEELFSRLSATGDQAELRQLSHELSFRTTPRAKGLSQKLEQKLTARPTSTNAAASGPTGGGGRGGNGGSGRPPNSSKQSHKPTPEQTQAIDKFLGGGSLKINAYAGTGKTSTLQMVAHATNKRGQYIAFNRDIVRDAKEKFPSSVDCSTTHGLAFRATPSQYKSSPDKMTGKINAHKLVDLLNLKKSWRIDQDFALQPVSQGSLILKTLQKFTQSADKEPAVQHVPRLGALLAAPEPVLRTVEDFAVRGARHLWERMQDPADLIPLGHDGYLKLWALSEPQLAVDYILLDEAQDTNPVVLDVLRRQPAQIVYVGDKYQQIYEWRGAVNAMQEIQTDATTYLTKSFRFGDTIARAATNVLRTLGEDKPIQGNEAIRSRIGPTQPRTILARTNSSTITAIIDALDQGQKPYLVGGNAELMEMLKGVQDLKNGQPSTVPDFFGFLNWNDVVSFAKSGEGEHLLTFVNLVEARGERQLMWALNRVGNEENKCDIIVSTAHKAKGREWPRVRLMDDFLKSKPRRPEPGQERPKGPDPSELRLFYVALTRAREELEVAPNVLGLLGIKESAANSTHTSSQRLDSSARPTHQHQSNARNEWVPPSDWQPKGSPRREPPNQTVSPPIKEAKKGFIKWLFGR